LQIRTCGELRVSGTLPEAVIFDAVCRNIEIIGEAAGKVGPEFREAHPEIPWRQMISARNILIHNYDGIEPAIVWAIVEGSIPTLLHAVLHLLGESRD
jgi:uncharacterized protein with HEPN domain